MSLAFFGSPRWNSAAVRGKQIADRLGAPYNPPEIPTGADCIFVKQAPEAAPDRCWIDIVDAHSLIYWLTQHPESAVIALSETAASYLREHLPSHRIEVIPQQHCNDACQVRDERPVKMVGYIGCRSGFQVDRREMQAACAEFGLEFRQHASRWFEKEGVVSFYLGLDIQVAYRIYARHDRNWRLKDALKVMNAGSFGIPTVCLPEPGYDAEAPDAYVRVETREDLVRECRRLATDPAWYAEMSARAREAAAAHHIDRVLPRYEELAWT